MYKTGPYSIGVPVRIVLLLSIRSNEDGIQQQDFLYLKPLGVYKHAIPDVKWVNAEQINGSFIYVLNVVPKNEDKSKDNRRYGEPKLINLDLII